ncbi:MAG: hypothetical protein QOJ11_4314 [Frankiales bacterium]|nr:hypothetical protein [Frankiales bacterium]
MNDNQVSDETLESWFAAAASEYGVPADAFEKVLSAAGESAKPRAARFQHPRLVAAAVLIIVAAGGATAWNGVGHGGTPATATSASSSSSAGAAHGAPTVRSPGRTPGSTTDFSNDVAAAPAAPPAPAVSALPTGRSASFTDAMQGSAKNLGATADSAKIVHTGSLGLTVAKGQVSPVLTRLTSLATGVGGYVSSSTTAESGSRPTGTVVLRVPAGTYDTALTQARALGTVNSTSSSAKDVTGSYTDLQARETALKKTRDHYLTLLAKATTIGETLSVQQRVDDAQTQIDQLQGQLNVLGDQASYGTLSVTVTQKAPAVVAAKTKPVHHQSGMSKAWHRAVDGFVTGVEALVARSGRAVLVLIVLVVGLGLLRVAWKVGRRRLV